MIKRDISNIIIRDSWYWNWLNQESCKEVLFANKIKGRKIINREYLYNLRIILPVN